MSVAQGGDRRTFRELRCSLAKLLDEDMCSVLEAKAASALKADVESQLQSIQALVDGIESLAADAVSARTSATEVWCSDASFVDTLYHGLFIKASDFY